MSASARLGGTDQRRPPVPFRRIITCACATLIYLPQHLRWRGSQVVRQGSAKALCVGSIPTLASTQFSLGFGGKWSGRHCAGRRSNEGPITHSQGSWTELRRHLEDRRGEINNNLAENASWPTDIGKKSRCIRYANCSSARWTCKRRGLKSKASKPVPPSMGAALKARRCGNRPALRAGWCR